MGSSSRSAHSIAMTSNIREFKRASLTESAIQEIQDAVRGMQNNIAAVGQRGERLDALQDKTDNLATQANGFRRGANRVRKQMWWKDMKMRMCIIVGIIVLLVIIIVPSGKSSIVPKLKASEHSTDTMTVMATK